MNISIQSDDGDFACVAVVGRVTQDDAALFSDPLMNVLGDTAYGRRVLIEPPPEEELIPEEVQSLKQFIGQQGMAITPMLPSGAIRLSSQTIDAISEGMSIDKGTPIEVVAARGNHLVVQLEAKEMHGRLPEQKGSGSRGGFSFSKQLADVCCIGRQ